MDLDQSIKKGELPGQNDEHCRIDVPLHSPGMLNIGGLHDFFSYTLPRLQLQLALFFLFSQGIHLVTKRVAPRIVAEILAGMVVGPSFLGGFSHVMEETLLSPQGEIFLDVISKMGFLFFMFLVGVKMDPSMVFKTRYKAWIIGLTALAVPQLVGYLISDKYDTRLPLYRRPAVRSIITVQQLVPFPVIASLLMDLKILNSELGRLALASTLICDVSGTIVYLFQNIFRLKFAGLTLEMTIHSAILSFAFVGVTIVGTRVISLWIIKQTPEGKPVKRAYIALFGALVMVASVISDNVGLQYYIGPFILGLSVPDGPPLGSTLVEGMETLVSGLFAPLLMAFCGMKTNIRVIYDIRYLKIMLQALIVMYVTKYLAVLIPAWALCKVPPRDATALALIMSAQGIVEIAVYDNNFRNQTIDDVSFSFLTFSVLIIALATSLLVKIVYDYSRTYTGYQKRNIMHTSYNAELRVLACAHRQDDALAVIKLLEASNPTHDSPIAAYALNLVELVGRASPLLINHKLGQKVSTIGSRSQQLIDAFQMFEQQFSGLVTVQVFTAISIPKFMHHDICSLAFDKLSSLIILPFHKKWNQQGKIIFDNNVLRTINIQVLEMAPCSVAILVDRRKIRHEGVSNLQQAFYNVGMIFLGGDDDRETLAYGKRMAKSPGVNLTVIRLVAVDDTCENHWDTVLDTETLKDIKIQSAHQSNVMYREEKAKDGPDTALVVNAVAEGFDLLMVGRRHKEDSPLLSGISEWSDLPELGPIGDILASSDIKKPISVLVVQQQVVKGKAS